MMTPRPLSLTIPGGLYGQLARHLFPGDCDEHGAVIAAGLAETDGGYRLLARSVHPAADRCDYLPGRHGYRMLTAPFVRDRVLECRDERLVYLAVHNHGGRDAVAFSPDDLRSHERGYPALLDIAKGMPVGALVFAENAVAGDIWFPDGRRLPLAGARVLSSPWLSIAPEPPPRPGDSGALYDRQSRLFGDAGQAILRGLRVGIIGAGGAGSLLVEMLARLGVGHLVVADPDRVELSNLPRLVGATRRNAVPWLTGERCPEWLRRIGRRLATPKVTLAERSAKRASPSIRFEAIGDDFLLPEVARRFIACDYLFLAADPMPVRLLFNAMVHQYLIPGVQLGCKVRVNETTGGLLDVYSVSRPVTPDSGCLWCNGLIPPAQLQEAAQSEEERRRQRYVNDATIVAPSVITLNATVAAQAANDFLFTVTGLLLPGTGSDYMRSDPLRRRFLFEEPRRDPDCPECGNGATGRRGRGDGRALPTKD